MRFQYYDTYWGTKESPYLFLFFTLIRIKT
jgi:hypothetical protein